MVDSSQYECEVLILGEGVGSFILGRLLVQQKISVKLVRFGPISQSIEEKENFYPIDLNLLKKYSIPYLEMSFKNAHNLSAFIERFTSLEKFFLEPVIKKDKTKSDGQFFNESTYGIVNTTKFLKYLRKLSELKHLEVINVTKEDEFSIKKENSNYSVKLNGNQSVRCKNIIIADHIGEKILNDSKILIQKSDCFYVLSYQVDTILSDAIEYYFDFSLKCPFISVIPGKNKTKISLYTSKIDKSFDYKQIIELVLKEKYELSYEKEQVRFFSQKVLYKHISLKNEYNIPIVFNGINSGLISEPIFFNPVSLAIESAFICFRNLNNSASQNYSSITEKLISRYNSINGFFFCLPKNDVYLFGRILAKKFITDLNFFQRLLIKIRIKSLTRTEKEGISVTDILSVLSHSNVVEFN